MPAKQPLRFLNFHQLETPLKTSNTSCLKNGTFLGFPAGTFHHLFQPSNSHLPQPVGRLDLHVLFENRVQFLETFKRVPPAGVIWLPVGIFGTENGRTINPSTGPCGQWKMLTRGLWHSSYTNSLVNRDLYHGLWYGEKNLPIYSKESRLWFLLMCFPKWTNFRVPKWLCGQFIHLPFLQKLLLVKRGVYMCVYNMDNILCINSGIFSSASKLPRGPYIIWSPNHPLPNPNDHLPCTSAGSKLTTEKPGYDWRMATASAFHNLPSSKLQQWNSLCSEFHY